MFHYNITLLKQLKFIAISGQNYVIDVITEAS